MERAPSRGVQKQEQRGNLSSESLTLQALLSGAFLSQMRPQAVQSFSHRIGNSTLLEMLSRTGHGPELVSWHHPMTPLDTEPLQWSDAPLELVTVPVFDSESGGACDAQS